MRHSLNILEKTGKLVHAFSTIEDGNMSYLWGNESDVLKNRLRFLRRIGVLENRCAVMSIYDESRVVSMGDDASLLGISKHERIPSDALITTEKNLFLFLVIADCIPVILFDRKKEVLALVHAGRKSADDGIARDTINFMKEKYHTEAGDIIVGMGPSIRKKSYVLDAVEQKKEKWGIFLNTLPDGRVSVDVTGYVKNELMLCGVKEENIEISNSDTFSSPFFFSHYRSKKKGEKEGRFCAVVGMV